MKNFLKKQQGFTLIELMGVVAIIGVLTAIVMPSYRQYITGAKWAKTIHETSALKLAIENCLADNSGDVGQCDSLDNGEMAAYAISEYPLANENFSQISLKPDTAEIEIIGKRPLGQCILTMSPSPSSAMISWKYAMKAGNPAIADDIKCASFVKGLKPTVKGPQFTF